MTAISKNVFIDKLDDMINEYNKTYRTIKMKPTNVNTSTYIDFYVERNYKDVKFEVGDHVRISKYKNIFSKGYTPNFSKEDFVIKKVKNTVSWMYVIEENGEKNVYFMRKNCKRETKKICQGYDDSFNSNS